MDRDISSKKEYGKADNHTPSPCSFPHSGANGVGGMQWPQQVSAHRNTLVSPFDFSKIFQRVAIFSK